MTSQTKRALAEEMFAQGATPYAVNKACRNQFGSGIAYYDLVKIRDDLAAKVTPVEIPPEILEDTALTSPAAFRAPTTHPEFVLRLRAVQDWMKVHRIEELVMDDKGRVSVLAWSEVDLGGSNG